MDKVRRKSGFYAYGSDPNAVASIIAKTIGLVNRIGGDLKLIDWRSLNVSGKIIISEVCKKIDESDIFVCDLTTHNHNVLFELGYAIAQRKPIWITLNANHEDSSDRYRELKLITTVGYIGYSNAHELQSRLIGNFNDYQPASTILDNFQGLVVAKKEHFSNSLFYMKSWVETKESVALQRALRGGKLTPIFDDPQEGTGQSLAWYVENTFHASAVLAHLSPDKHPDSRFDAKYSLAAGLAFGFGKPLLILAHKPYNTPIDFRDITFVHHSASSCLAAYNRWAQNLNRFDLTRKSRRASRIRANLDIRNVDLGHYLAENEEDTLREYFVRTNAFNEALNTRGYMLFVGRKGSGKTANLVMLSERMERQRDTHLCVIRPSRYEFEGILNLFTLSQVKAHTGYLLDAIWKFLIYSELAYSVYKRIKARPPHAVSTDSESRFVDYFESNKDILGTEFPDRLENAFTRICELEVYSGTPEQRQKVSEILHKKVIGLLREYLGDLLNAKRRVCILIDNLDKGWERREDLADLSRFLFGLISVAPDIADDFSAEHINRPRISLSMIMFLRSDIFSYLKQNASEPDKLVYSRISWSDVELLWQIVERRFANFGANIANESIYWRDFFIKEVQGQDIQQYVVERIIPRPRDMIFLFRSSLLNATNRNHVKVEEKDVVDAELEYSNFAIDLLLAEVNKVHAAMDKDLIYEFYAENEILTEYEVKERLSKRGVKEGDAYKVIDILIENSFFAPETSVDEFTFMYEDNERERIMAKWRKHIEANLCKRFRIHPAFHSALEITTSADY